MKKLFLVLILFLFVSTVFAQVELTTVGIPKKLSGQIITTYYERTYADSQTDTTYWIDHSSCDSIQYFFSSNDTAAVWFYLIYGDESKSRVISGMVDSVRATNSAGTFKSITWEKSIATVGSTYFNSRLVCVFKATGTYNNDTQGTAKYSIYIRKFKHK